MASQRCCVTWGQATLRRDMAEKRLKIANMCQEAFKPTWEQHCTIRYQEEWLFFLAGNIYPSNCNPEKEGSKFPQNIRNHSQHYMSRRPHSKTLVSLPTHKFASAPNTYKWWVGAYYAHQVTSSSMLFITIFIKQNTSIKSKLLSDKHKIILTRLMLTFSILYLKLKYTSHSNP